tara:strand:+ start:6049 stop:6426 length:378 start_codon:yes stop_codon:yes gene_type:complete
MEIDIKIYIQNLKKFFTSNEGGADLLKKTGIEIDEFLEEIEELAVSNYEKDGDPTLDKTQILHVLKVIELNKLKLGLESLVEEGKVEHIEQEEDKNKFKLTEEGLKELKESQIFQDTEFGRIYLN